jgi:hypothetical protein
MNTADETLRAIVLANLIAAEENGAFAPDGSLFGYTAEDIADDLNLFADDCAPEICREFINRN